MIHQKRPLTGGSGLVPIDGEADIGTAGLGLCDMRHPDRTADPQNRFTHPH